MIRNKRQIPKLPLLLPQGNWVWKPATPAKWATRTQQFGWRSNLTFNAILCRSFWQEQLMHLNIFFWFQKRKEFEFHKESSIYLCLPQRFHFLLSSTTQSNKNNTILCSKNLPLKYCLTVSDLSIFFFPKRNYERLKKAFKLVGNITK